MSNSNLNTEQDMGFLTFLDEEVEGNTSYSENGKWKIMIVDDDQEVHNVTRFILEDFKFENRQVELISAYSGTEALRMLETNPDTAVVFLDVVMENDLAGFYVAKYIRENINNKIVRIILRTGQPGTSPEKKAMIDYDINDYKLKTELTDDKLFVSLISALRSYRDIIKLEQNRSGLERLVSTSANIFKVSSFNEFILSVLKEMTSFFDFDLTRTDFAAHGFVATKIGEEYIIDGGIGKYNKVNTKKLSEVVNNDLMEQVGKALDKQEVFFESSTFILPFKAGEGKENLILFEFSERLEGLDEKLLELLCTNIKIAFDNIYLNDELETTQKEIIYTLGEVSEQRSRETGFHVKRVADYTALLARLYGLPDEEVKIIRMAAPMHDVGKLGIPDAILNKPGKLTEEEFEVIKNHSKIGYEMLKSSSRKVLQAATIIALQHHEKYDGTGYPLKLKGEDIHIYGRIAAVADVFDALAVKRVYKRAWELDEILKFFKEQKGKHFDPDLVDILFENLDKFIAIKDKYPDA